MDWEFIAAIKVTLLFHSESPWDEEKQRRWLALTGRSEVTTKALCDFLREVLDNYG